jgi:hypothetical protein
MCGKKELPTIRKQQGDTQKIDKRSKAKQSKQVKE